MSKQEKKIHSLRGAGSLRLSVAYAYAFGLALIIFFVYLAGPIELGSYLRVLDELADWGIVRDVDIGPWGLGHGIVVVPQDKYWASLERIAWDLIGLAFLFVALALLLRGIRQRLLAHHFGIASSVGGQISSYLFGRGLNLFFPFGPGELGTTEILIRNGAEPKAATTTVFYNRIFEIQSIAIILLIGFLIMGWGGVLVPLLSVLAILFALVILVRPFGSPTDTNSQQRGRFSRIRGFWSAVNGKAIGKATREIFHEAPSFAVGILLLSLVAIAIEAIGLFTLKQAFSTRGSVLGGDVPPMGFFMAIAAANLARIIPFTPASLGIYEGVLAAMFLAFGEDLLGSFAVAILEGFFGNFVMLLVFVLALRNAPSMVESWRNFLRLSTQRKEGQPLLEQT